jgi:hypothetical protein
MSRWRRAAGFALVPLSLLPLAAVAPAVAPSAARRIAELRGASQHPTTASTPTGRATSPRR